MPLPIATGMTSDLAKVIVLMVRGRDSRPLSLPAAATACGLGVRDVRDIARSEIFQDEFKAEIERYRQSLEPGNLAVALAIRDDHGDDSPECNSVRLRAIQVLRGTPKPPAVNIQINNKTDIYAKFTPGYVIKLDSGGPLIEHADDE